MTVVVLRKIAEAGKIIGIQAGGNLSCYNLGLFQAFVLKWQQYCVLAFWPVSPVWCAQLLEL